MLRHLAYGLAFVTVMAGMIGCGAKVSVDVLGAGQGGAGGAMTSTTGTTSSVTTGSGVSCSNTGCSGTSDGSCDCTDTCDVQGNTQKLEVQCAAASAGLSCTCIENGTKVAVCQGSGSSACDAVNGCCAGVFFGAGTGTGG